MASSTPEEQQQRSLPSLQCAACASGLGRHAHAWHSHSAGLEARDPRRALPPRHTSHRAARQRQQQACMCFQQTGSPGFAPITAVNVHPDTQPAAALCCEVCRVASSVGRRTRPLMHPLRVPVSAPWHAPLTVALCVFRLAACCCGPQYCAVATWVTCGTVAGIISGLPAFNVLMELRFTPCLALHPVGQQPLLLHTRRLPGTCTPAVSRH